MKKSAILWPTLAVLFIALVIEHARSYAAGPFEFTPNWLTILPFLAVFAGFISLIIRKERVASESRAQKAKAELMAVFAGTPLADY